MRRLVLTLLLLPGACASSSPDFYSLEARPGPVRAGVHRVILVRGVGLPRYLEREEIVRASGQGRLRVAENDWWGEPLRAMLRRVLVDDLAQRLPDAIVLADEGPIAPHPDTEVEVDVQSFNREQRERDAAELPAGLVVFGGYVAITRQGRPRVMERLRLVVPVAARTTKAQVDAMSSALGQVADAIVRQAGS